MKHVPPWGKKKKVGKYLTCHYSDWITSALPIRIDRGDYSARCGHGGEVNMGWHCYEWLRCVTESLAHVCNRHTHAIITPWMPLQAAAGNHHYHFVRLRTGSHQTFWAPCNTHAGMCVYTHTHTCIHGSLVATCTHCTKRVPVHDSAIVTETYHSFPQSHQAKPSDNRTVSRSPYWSTDY